MHSGLRVQHGHVHQGEPEQGDGAVEHFGHRYRVLPMRLSIAVSDRTSGTAVLVAVPTDRLSDCSVSPGHLHMASE
jgi:hypothetical protein